MSEQRRCPRCRGDTGGETVLCNECYLDICVLQRPIDGKEAAVVIAKPKFDAQEKCLLILHWLLGSKSPNGSKDLWALGEYRNEFLVATAAAVLWHKAVERLGSEGIALGHFLRFYRDQEKAILLLALGFDRGHPDNPEDTYNILLHDWAVKALIEWTSSAEAMEMIPNSSGN